ncbi:hypothetical protein ACCS66_35535 [Rhizobium ruizarguesonis]
MATDGEEDKPAENDPVVDVPEENGEPPGPDGGEATKVVPATGTTTINEEVNIEVVMLAVASVREIAVDIAGRVKRRIGSEPKLVLLCDEAWLGKVADWRAFSTRMSVLEEAMESLPALRQKSGSALEGIFVPMLGGTSAGIEAVANLLSFFKADTSYYGRSVAIESSTLYPALAGQLIENEIASVAIGGAPMLTGPADHRQDLIGRMERLVRLRTRLSMMLTEVLATKEADPPAEDYNSTVEQALSRNDDTTTGTNTAAPEATTAVNAEVAAGGGQHQPDQAQIQIRSLVEAADELMNDLTTAGDGTSRLAELQAGSETAHLIDTAPRAYQLSAKVIKSGGAYRTKKHLFTTLFFGDQLSYSGGAVISFILTDLKTMLVVDSDVIYHATGNVRFPGKVMELIPSSLKTRDGKPTVPPTDAENLAAQHSSGAEAPTPHSGDDEYAVQGDRWTVQTEGLGPAAGWRPAKSLLVLRNQIDRIAPRRRKESDGIIGDAAHQSRNSDHNPWVIDEGKGVVTAIDITHDPRNNCSAERIAAAIRDSRDARVKYLIWNRSIAHSMQVGSAAPWTWLAYTEDNPHTEHIHISVKPEKLAYDSERAWHI